MADARGLGPRGETLAGSSPVSPTIFKAMATRVTLAKVCPKRTGFACILGGTSFAFTQSNPIWQDFFESNSFEARLQDRLQLNFSGTPQ